MPARPPGEPFADQRCLASGVVVHDQVAVEIAGHAGSDLVEALAEPCGAAARIAFADDAAGGDVEGDEQGARPMALVVVGHPRQLASPHRRHGLGAVKRLDCDFSSTQSTRALRCGGSRLICVSRRDRHWGHRLTWLEEPRVARKCMVRVVQTREPIHSRKLKRKSNRRARRFLTLVKTSGCAPTTLDRSALAELVKRCCRAPK